MAEVDIDIGKKRRLPLWMLGVTAADQVRKSGKGDEYIELNEEKVSQKALRPKSKSIPKRVEKKETSHEKEASEVDPVLLVRCDKRERARKSGKKAANSDNFVSKDRKTSLKNTKKRRGVKESVMEHVSPKKRKTKNHELERSDSLEGSPASKESDDDEGELTMEDLISMAKEYVKADNQDEAPTLTTSKPELEDKIILPSKPIFSSREWGLKPVKSGREASMPETAEPAMSHSIVTDRREKVSLTNQGQSQTVGSAKDPTEDMLDLFLGPLLKKPQIEEKVESFAEDINWECSFSQDIDKEVMEVEEFPLMKKKSSLKDTVAMFLTEDGA